MSRARLSVVGLLLAVSAALAVGHARIGGGGVAAADVRRPGRSPPRPAESGARRPRVPPERGRGAGRGAGARRAPAGGAAHRRRGASRPRPPAARSPPSRARSPSRSATARCRRRAPGAACARPSRPRTSAAARTRRRRARSRSCGACPRATCRSPRTSRSPSRSRWSRSTRTRRSRARRSRRGSRPQPPGEWRWVGTRTLVFEPEGRFPMATDYRVEVPAGTRAATGGTLAERRRLVVLDAPAAARGAPPGGRARRGATR